ncbi:MAG: S-layer homology domain-containing protein [Candidatus Gracilibacteria bacterium]
MRRILTSALLITMLASVPLTAFAASKFQDVPEGSLYYKPIEYFASLGVVQGYPDTTTGLSYFKPDKNVNRAEAIKIILAGGVKQYTFATSLSENVFPDVKPQEWFAPYVKAAKDEGIVKGNDKTGLFEPGRTVNKAELLKMVFLANAVDITSIQKEVSGTVSNDVSKNAWYYPYMLYAKEFGIIFPDTLGNFNPGKELTRGEVMEIMYNTAKILKGGFTQQLLSRTEAKIFSSITKINLQNYDEALADINIAKEYSDRALLASPSETIVQEANKITAAFALSIEGFKIWKKDGNLTLAKTKAQEAANLVANITELTELKKSLMILINALNNAV